MLNHGAIRLSRLRGVKVNSTYAARYPAGQLWHVFVAQAQGVLKQLPSAFPERFESLLSTDKTGLWRWVAVANIFVERIVSWHQNDWLMANLQLFHGACSNDLASLPDLAGIVTSLGSHRVRSFALPRMWMEVNRSARKQPLNISPRARTKFVMSTKAWRTEQGFYKSLYDNGSTATPADRRASLKYVLGPVPVCEEFSLHFHPTRLWRRYHLPYHVAQTFNDLIYDLQHLVQRVLPSHLLVCNEINASRMS